MNTITPDSFPVEKTDTFFVISNYNTDPEIYLHYCNDYHIYDQSDNSQITSILQSKYSKISFVENSGHSITNYFRYFIDNYEYLPKFLMLAKGNMIGRHISKNYFDRIYKNKFYTPLYSDRGWKDKPGIAYELYDGAFLEINNNWYVDAKSHQYFRTYNELLAFIFKAPILPNWLLFSPGACYIVSREQVLRYPKAFYENLKYLVSYTYFPAEAYHVERMLNIIFSACYELQPHMLCEIEFQKKLDYLLKAKLEIGYSIYDKFKMSFKRRYNILLNRLILK
jgi:hypothetical protein